jgi:hypothetical protein
MEDSKCEKIDQQKDSGDAEQSAFSLASTPASFLLDCERICK